MSRAQLEISFQWVFVLIAGASFLVLFFFLMKGCAQSSTAENQGLGVKYTSSAISGAAWQPEANSTISSQKAIVTCQAGVLTLAAGSASSPLSLSPSFLPPVLSGRTQLLTHQVATQGAAPIVLGNVLYAIDDQTEYFFIKDNNDYSRYIVALGSPRNMHAVDAGDLKTQVVPTTATSVVIISGQSLSSFPASSLPAYKGSVYGVSFLPGQVAQFYEWQGNAFSTPKTVDYTEEAFALGAIITARADNFNCARAAFATRSRIITGIAESRITRLLASVDLDDSCKPQLNAAKTALDTINKKSDDSAYLRAILDIGQGTTGKTIMDQQQMLYYNSKCPVIS